MRPGSGTIQREHLRNAAHRASIDKGHDRERLRLRLRLRLRFVFAYVGTYKSRGYIQYFISSHSRDYPSPILRPIGYARDECGERMAKVCQT